MLRIAFTLVLSLLVCAPALADGFISSRPTPEFYGVSVTNSAAQVDQNLTTAGTITFDTEDYDTDDFHSTTSNTGRLTIPARFAGFYATAQAYLSLTNGTGGEWVQLCVLHIDSADSTKENRCLNNSSAGFRTMGVILPHVLLVEGDYFTMTVQSQTDTMVDIDTASRLSARVVAR